MSNGMVRWANTSELPVKYKVFWVAMIIFQLKRMSGVSVNVCGCRKAKQIGVADLSWFSSYGVPKVTANGTSIITICLSPMPLSDILNTMSVKPGNSG